jgi:hypothetical protein
MIMFQVEWLREGQSVDKFTAHALDEADAVRLVEGFFLENPDQDIEGGRDGTMVRVGRVIHRNGHYEVIFPAEF